MYKIMIACASYIIQGYSNIKLITHIMSYLLRALAICLKVNYCSNYTCNGISLFLLTHPFVTDWTTLIQLDILFREQL